MEKIPFTKPATTIDQQIQILKDRGMIFPDETCACRQLMHISYYRLTAYWLMFEQNHTQHQFKNGTSFTEVMNHYQFDESLRKLVLQATTQIEISFRNQFAYHLSHAYTPHAHLNYRYYDPKVWISNLGAVLKEKSRSIETFVKHFDTTYEEPLPPIWAVTELITFGTLSKWYNSLKQQKVRKQIAKTYLIDHKTFTSWLHTLSVLRNFCAHNARIWNREFTITPSRPQNIKTITPCWQNSRRIYNTLLLITYLLDIIQPSNTWKTELLFLISQYNINPAYMGFPSDYLNNPFWR